MGLQIVHVPAGGWGALGTGFLWQGPAFRGLALIARVFASSNHRFEGSKSIH